MKAKVSGVTIPYVIEERRPGDIAVCYSDPGKTSALELLDCCYSIIEGFQVENKYYSYDGIELEIFFYHEGFLYL